MPKDTPHALDQDQAMRLIIDTIQWRSDDDKAAVLHAFHLDHDDDSHTAELEYQAELEREASQDPANEPDELDVLRAELERTRAELRTYTHGTDAI